MRTFVGVLLSSLILVVWTTTVSAGEFEGIIHMKTTHAGQPGSMNMDLYFKGDKARMEGAPGEGRKWISIVDYRKRTTTMPMPEKKMYWEMPMDNAQEGIQEALEKYTMEKTGKTDKVAGYSCEVWLVKDKETGKLKSETCVAKGFGNAAGSFWTAGADKSGRSGQPAWMKQLAKEGAFSLRMITRNDDGTEQMRMEVTSIEKKRLDASLFVMPADYTKFEMGAMMGGGAGRPGEPGAAGGSGGVDFQQMMRDA